MTTGKRFLGANARNLKKASKMLGRKLAHAYYPYAKVISNARKDLQGSLCLACTPPQPGQFPAITRMQKLSAVQEATFAQRVPPPTRGRFPLLPVCKSYQQCARPTAGPSSEVLGYISVDKGQYCPRTTPSGWTAGHSLLVLLQSWHMPAVR